jgi:hypothetical protein
VLESNTTGYNLYRRQTADGAWVRLNADVIRSQPPGSSTPNSYTFDDHTTQPGVEYTYRLEEINTGLQPTDYWTLTIKYYFSYMPMASQTGPKH